MLVFGGYAAGISYLIAKFRFGHTLSTFLYGGGAMLLSVIGASIGMSNINFFYWIFYCVAGGALSLWVHMEKEF